MLIVKFEVKKHMHYIPEIPTLSNFSSHAWNETKNVGEEEPDLLVIDTLFTMMCSINLHSPKTNMTLENHHC